MRRFNLILALSGFLLLMAACQGPLASRDTPTPEISVLPALPTAQTYLDAWQEQDHEAMYALLSSSAQEGITEEEFIWVHDSVIEEATALAHDLEMGEVVEGEATAQAGFTLTLDTAGGGTTGNRGRESSSG